MHQMHQGRQVTDPRWPLYRLDQVRACLRRSAWLIGCSKGAVQTSAALTIRRSSARRRPQRSLRLGVLPQNGAGGEHWCPAAPGWTSTDPAGTALWVDE
jgi:hypothetical protein